MAIASIERRQGKWAESTADFEKAASLSPKDAFVLVNLGDNYRANNNFEVADTIFDRAIEAAPSSLSARAEKGKLALDLKGDFSEIERQLAQMAGWDDPEKLVTLYRAKILILQRKFTEAFAVLNQLPQEVTHALAQIYAWVGEKDQALRLVDRLLQTPNGVTVAMLKLDPMWDPLGADPRFQRLVALQASSNTTP